ncbi:MAG: hypothetical protein K6U00_09730 [Armatimonadetes bacterium]|nr:hypothetical protein [Armatimonadota bacterium]
MSKRIVLGVLLPNRFDEAPEFQKLITKYGCVIRTRLGLHEVCDHKCSVSGLILLEMYGDESQILELEDKLRHFDGIQVQKMVFEESTVQQ